MLTNKVYVGKTVKDIQERFAQHIRNGRKIDNASEISKSLREHGTLNHKIEVLESCEDVVLLVREQYWIDNLNTLQLGYNIKNEHLNKKDKTYWGEEELAIKNMAAGRTWNTGISPKKETRERIANTKKERAQCGLYDNSYGHKHTEETKKFLSEIAKNRPAPSKETREKLKQASSGRTCYYNPNEKKRVFLKGGNDIPTGYIRGKGTRWMNRNDENISVDIWEESKYTKNGYKKGRIICGKR